MNGRRAFLALLAGMPGVALAQGFAGLGTTAEGFSVPRRGTDLRFPQDHGPHPDFRIEWWYLTSNLRGVDGTEYGLQFTLFRSALAPQTRDGWDDPQIWLGHAAVTTPQAHHVAERYARGGIGQAGVVAQPFRAWIDEWEMSGEIDRLRLSAAGQDFGYDVELTAEGPLVLHGDNGFSVKSQQGQASYYYSQPFYTVTGQLWLPEGEVAVTGSAWLDREWSSQPLADTQSGWDWFSLSFDDGTKLMAFVLRETGGGTFTSATWIAADGDTTAYGDGAIQATPLQWHETAGRQLPVAWRLILADKAVDITLSPINPDSWMATSVPYWEGPMRIDGTHMGRGYLEMTGYE